MRLTGLAGFTDLTLLDQLGETVVVRARDTDDEHVIIKTHASNLPHADARERLRREHDTTAAARNEHLVQARALIDQPNRAALVLSDPGDRSLATHLAEDEPTLPDLLDVAVDVADALVALHAAGVAHRGVDAHHIMVTATGAVLVDLYDGCVAGRTPRRATQGLHPAPEQLGSDLLPATTASDQYSLATTVDLACRQLGWEIPPGLRSILDQATRADPHHRYRSALGLRRDLVRARDSLRRDDECPAFDLSTECPRLRWEDPPELVGRDGVLEELRSHIDAVATDGTGRVVVVRSEPGTGASSLAAALCDQLADAAILSGLGQFEKGGPVLPLQAPVELMEQVVALLLATPEEIVERLRTDLIQRLGTDLPLATQIIPALEPLVGAQPSPPDTAPEEAISRVERAVRVAIATIAHSLPPLVAVFDDADRADRSSLRTLEILAGHPEVGPLAVILVSDHRSRRLDPLLDQLRRQEVDVREMVLAPLTPLAISELLALGTGSSVQHVTPLGEAVWARSGGSPTVALDDIWQLTTSGHLWIDVAAARWTWDDEALVVVEPDDLDTVSARRIDHLEPELRDVVSATAVAGRAASVEMLAEWAGCDHDTMIRLVDRAVDARVLVRHPVDHQHRVLCADNSIRRAALDALHGDAFDELRHAVARAIVATAPRDPAGAPMVDDESRFVLIDLLRGQPSLEQPGEDRRLFLRLCEEAGRHAHRNAAFQEALDFQLTALALLSSDGWRSDPDLTFELHLRAAEHALILGRAGLVDDLLDRMGLDDLAAAQRVRALRILGTRAWTRGDLDTGLESLRTILAELGEPIPDPVGWADIGREYLAVRRALTGTEPESLLTAPVLTDERVAAALEAMLACVHLAYVDQPLTHMWLVLRGTQLTARYGVGDASAYYLTGYGMLNLSLPAGIGTGLRFGHVGRELASRSSAGVDTMVAFAHDAFVRHWGEPLGDTIEPLQERFLDSVATRQRGYGLSGGTFAVLHGLLASRPLPRLDQQAAASADDLAALDEHRFRVRVEIIRQAIVDLVDGPGGTILSGRHFDVEEWSSGRQRGGELAMIVHTVRALVALCVGDGDSMRRSTTAAGRLVRTAPGQAVLGQHWYHEAYLDAVAFADARSRRERLSRRARSERSLRRLRSLAHHAPANAGHRVALIEAIVAEGRGVEATARAMDRYERAVSLATANGALHDLGVAAERAAMFHAGRDRLALGRHYAGVARDAWEAWGAAAVADTVGDRLPPGVTIRTPTSRGSVDPEPTAPSTDSTTETLAEASSLLGQELEVREFLEGLIEILMRHTEATRGWLVLQSGTGPRVEVAGQVVGDTVEIAPLGSVSLEDHAELCRPAVNYVLRTRQVLSVVDPASDRRLRADLSLRSRSPRSLLGLPVGRSGTTTGVLILESDTYTHAFEPARIEALRVLSAQAISAIDQARLSSDLSILSDDVSELRQTADTLTTRAETDPLTGIANRAGMEARLHAAIRAANAPDHHAGADPGAQVGVLFCDLDDFKAVNDHHGHAAGDTVLIAIAQRLESVTRTDDIVARIGGDEFVVVSVGVSTPELEQMADRALSEIAQAIAIEPDGAITASVSIGIGRADLGEVTSIDDVDALVRVADRAMYEAKHSGKNQVSTGTA
ncbi:MAG: diguanylate cyclase domain-containing protein [Acidimicrobiales bacterium]